MLLDEKGRLFGRLSLLDVGIAGGLLLVLSPLWFLARVADHAAFRIHTVDPTQVIAGRDKKLDVMVTGAINSGKAYTVPFPLPNATVQNEARYFVPLDNALPPGLRSLIIQNSKGRFTWLENAFQVVWHPEIHAVQPNQVRVGSNPTFVIEGKYFHPNCKVTFANQPIGGSFLSVRPNRIEIRRFPMKLKPGKYRIRVTSPNGPTAVSKEFIEVVSLRSIPLVVTYAVYEPSTWALRKLKPGTKVQYEDGTAAGKILHSNLHTSDATEILVATLLVTGEIGKGEKETSYFYDGQPIGTGLRSQLTFFPVGNQYPFSTQGILLMEPRPEPGRAGELVSSPALQPDSVVLDEQ